MFSHRSIKVTLFCEKHIEIFSKIILTYHQIAPFFVLLLVTAQFLHSSDAKIHENRLRRWDFRTPASYSHDLRGSAPICSDQILLLYMLPALIHDGAHVVIRQRVKHGLTLTSAGHELCLL